MLSQGRAQVRWINWVLPLSLSHHLWLLPSCFELWHGCFPRRACTKATRSLSAEFLAAIQTQRSVIGSLGSASENHSFRRCGKHRHSHRQSWTLLQLLHHTLHTLFHYPLIKHSVAQGQGSLDRESPDFRREP